MKTSRPKTAKVEQELYRDCHGVAFSDVLYLIGDRDRWPKIRRVKNPAVCAFMHDQWFYCWNCGGTDKVEAHHEFAGSRGKSDELCAMIMLCRECHGDVHTTKLPLGRLLWLKWSFDPMHTDWIRCTLLRGSFLPDLLQRVEDESWRQAMWLKRELQHQKFNQ